MSPVRPVVISSLMALVAAGCAGRSRPVTTPTDSGTPPSSVRADCRGTLDLTGDRIRFDAAVAVKQPDRIYAEIAGRVGSPRAILAVKGKNLRLLLPRSREYLEEDATPEVYEALLGVRLETEDLAALFGLAGVPGERKVGSLRLQSHGMDLEVTPDTGNGTGFLRLKLRFRSLERVEEAEIETALFDPPVPAGWRRVVLEKKPAGEPVLFP